MRKVLYIFGALNDQDIDWLVRFGRRKPFSAGDVFIREGEQSDDLIIVIEGSLGVHAEATGKVASLNVGEIVGEMSFVDSAPPSATVAAETNGRALLIAKDEIRRELAGNVGFASRFYRAMSLLLADRLRKSLLRDSPGAPTGLDDTMDDKLDPLLLDMVSEAGHGFNRLIQRLSR